MNTSKIPPLALRLSLALGAALLTAALGPGCKSKDDKSDAERTAEASAATVADVCEQRKKEWTRAIHVACTKCQSLASTPRCSDCNKAPWAGQCAQLKSDYVAAESCKEARICQIKCHHDDCACMAKCFEGKPECDKLAAAVDVCTTEQCVSECK